MANGDDELDPDFRGPAPGREPWERDTPPIRDPRDLFGSQAGSLAQLAAVRIRPRTGPYAQGLLMYELGQRTAREAASRQVVAPASWLSDIPKAPWARRAKLGKGGRLYTLADVQRNVVRNNQAVNRAKEEGLKRAAAKAARAFAASTKRAGFDVGNPLAETLTQEWLGRKLDDAQRQRERQRRIQSFNRRGSLATRTIQPRTNRTGAAATRALQPPGPRPGASTGTERAASTAKKLPTGRDPIVRPQVEFPLPEETKASKEARRVMSEAKTIPGIRSVLQLPQRIMSRLSVSVRSMLPTNFARMIRPRVQRTGLTSSDLRTAPTLSLLPANTLGVGSLVSSANCSCPKPSKPQKQRREKGCSNPLISRTERDGIITIKRKLQCPQSKPK